MRRLAVVSGLALLTLALPSAATAQMVMATGEGCPSEIHLIEPGSTRSVFPYDPRFLGGVNVTMGDVNADGVPEVITGAGPGGGPHVLVLNGTDLSVLASFFAFDANFRGGVNVAAGDVNGDGRADIITGAGFGGSPHVVVYSGADLSVLASFLAYDANFIGGVRVAAGDVNGDGRSDIITGAGPTGGPHVAVFSGVDLSVLGSFYGFNPGFRGGVYVAAGDMTGDGRAEVMVGASAPGTPHVIVYSGDGVVMYASFFAFDPAYPAGVQVAMGDLNSDGHADLIMGTGQGMPNALRVVSGLDFSDLARLPMAPSNCGVMVGSTGQPGGVRLTSASTASFTVGTPGTFTVTTTGSPAPALMETGALPAGLTFTDNGDGTAMLSGTPDPATGGTYPLTLTADNGVAAPATQDFTLLVMQPPAVTSAAAATLTIGTPGAFSVTTTGFPVPTLSIGGPLPAGLTFVDNGNGTGTLSGTPPLTSAGTFALSFTATNGVGVPFVQAFTLTVNGSPTFTSAASTTFALGASNSFTVTTVASPTATLSVGALPAGVSFTDNANGTGTLAGTPAAGTAGPHTLTFTASNGVGGPVTQTFTLNVTEGPVITSASSASFALGAPNNFTVTTSGFPAATLVQGGAALPAGVTFVDNGNGTGTLSGTPAAGTGGNYALTFTATNTTGSAVQNFTLTVAGSPGFTSANTTTFTASSAGSFTVTTTGSPTPSLAVTGTLPAGVTFIDNGNGTGTLSGTPAAGTGGTYPLTFTASNGVPPDGTQAFTLLVNQAPVVTSAPSATFVIGAPGSFTVTTSGFPAPSLTRGGQALPAGLTFVDNGNGTGTLSGTPAPLTADVYAISFTATNTAGASAPQAFTLTVNQAPAFTSVNTTTFTVGTPGSFDVTVSGTPLAGLAVSGTLPAGVTFVDNANGTGTLSGTPGAGTGGSYALTFTASNGVPPNGTQAFTLIVNQAPAVTSAAATTFTVGTPASFSVTTSGFPAPALARGGVALPAGVTFVDNGNGTGTLAGTPVAGTGGTYAISFTATNTVGSSAPQAFTLTVNQAPAITSANSASFVVGAAGSFTVTTTGFPAPTIVRTGAALPAGVTFVDNGNGTGTLSGTPAAGTAAAYAFTFTAANGVTPDGAQTFTLNVNAPPAITSLATDSFTVGTADTFTVTTTGFPTPTVSAAGTLPTGVTFTPGTNALGGTATQTGSFPLVFTATNAIVPDATQNFTLNVVCPTITVTPLVMPDGLYQTVYAGVDFNQTGSTGATFTWGATGLPAGLTIDVNTGAVSGTATNTVATGGVAVTVTDNFGCQGTLNTAITVRPVADNENYVNGVGNTQYVVGAIPVVTPHVLNADALNANVKMGDNGPGTLSVAFNAAANGIVVEGGTDGTFTYTPNVGFAGPTDSFTYTLTDGNGVTNTATVTINLSGLVWYVNSSGGNGDGRSHNPFNTLASADTAATGNSAVYVHTGGATTPGNITLDANQTLNGQGATFNLNGLTITAGTRPTLTGTVTLANNTSVTAVNFTPIGNPAMSASAVTGSITIGQVDVTGGTNALSLTNVSGLVTVTQANFTNTTGAEVLMNQGSSNVTIGATISSNAGRSIDIQNRTGGIVSFTGPITDTGSGIFLNNNPASTINFSGGLSLATTTSPGFTATGGGTVSATQNNTTIVNTIATTTGTALNVANTTIGASGLTFRSISANGASKGITLNNTGTGAFTVTGQGTTDGSGGTIQSTTSNGAEFITTGSVALSNMNFTGNGTSQAVAGNAPSCGGDLTGVGNLGCVSNIHLQSITGVTLTNLNVLNGGQMGINGNNVTNFSLINSVVTGNGNESMENGLTFQNLLGTSAITNSIIKDNAAYQVNVTNTANSSTLTLNVTGTRTNNAYPSMDTSTTEIGRTSPSGAFTNQGFLFNSATAATNLNATINFSGVVFNNTYPGNAVLMNPIAASGSFAGTTTDSSFDTSGGGVIIQMQNGMSGNYSVTNSEFYRTALQHILFSGLNPYNGTFQAVAQGNTLGAAAASGSACFPTTGANCVGIDVNLIGGTGAIQTRIQSNTVQQFDGVGIRFTANGAGSLHANVVSNTVQNPLGLVARGIDTNIGTTTGAAIVGCFSISNNTINGTFEDPGVGTQLGINTRVRFNSEHRLPGMTGTGTANAQTFLNTSNPGAGGKVFTQGSGVPGYQSGAACTTP